MVLLHPPSPELLLLSMASQALGCPLGHQGSAGPAESPRCPRRPALSRSNAIRACPSPVLPQSGSLLLELTGPAGDHSCCSEGAASDRTCRGVLLDLVILQTPQGFTGPLCQTSVSPFSWTSSVPCKPIGRVSPWSQLQRLCLFRCWRGLIFGVNLSSLAEVLEVC